MNFLPGDNPIRMRRNYNTKGDFTVFESMRHLQTSVSFYLYVSHAFFHKFEKWTLLTSSTQLASDLVMPKKCIKM